MLIDLHTHTKASDGTFSAKELITYALSNSIDVLSITDHDSIDSLKNIDFNEFKGLKLISGIEFGCAFKGFELHILGYNIDIFSSDLKKTLSFLTEKRVERIMDMISKLNSLGVNLKYSDLEPESADIKGRMHLARVLCKKGFVKDEQEAFTKYLGFNKNAYVPKISISAEETLSLIKSIGGISVIAHPFVSMLTEEILEEILSLEIDGLEVYHPKHNNFQKEYLKNKALEKGLLITGGSDFHGVNDGTVMNIGSYDYPQEFFYKFMERVGQL